MHLAKVALQNGGKVIPLILPAEITMGNGTMNPSIFIHESKILVNIRVVNYILYHSEGRRYQHLYGPLQYIHPEADRFLRTTNYLAELDSDYNIVRLDKVDTSVLDKPPEWEFVGLEDARLFSFNNKLYLCGVRRDTTPNGQGRMELVEITINKKMVREISRKRIPAPGENNTYCEKNWVPILDQPFKFLKWTVPTEIVEYKDGTTTTVEFKHQNHVTLPADQRGSSQVIPYKDGYLAVMHEVYLYNNELGSKDATYRHRIFYFDKEFNILRHTNKFSFMDGEVEFCCGAAILKDNLIITYGFQDNSAFLLEMPLNTLDTLWIN